MSKGGELDQDDNVFCILFSSIKCRESTMCKTGKAERRPAGSRVKKRGNQKRAMKFGCALYWSEYIHDI